MAQYVSSVIPSITDSLKVWLPQNNHTKKAVSLEKEIDSLETSLKERTENVFQSKLAETIQRANQEKIKCLSDLARMNGDYYQDPKASLKINWDRLVESVAKAINVKVERLEQLTEVYKQLNETPDDAAPTPSEKKLEDGPITQAKKKIGHYQFIAQKRDTRKTQLENIIAIEKASLANIEAQLQQTKKALLAEHRELCGDYFGDSNGKLDMAWRKYQDDLQCGTLKDSSFKTYQGLEERRKKVEAELHLVEQQLAIPASSNYTFETLTADSISNQIKESKAALSQESALSGVDWTATGATAAETALAAAGILFL